MTGIIYPQILEYCKIDLLADKATIEVELLELRPSSGERFGGGSRQIVTVPLRSTLTRHEKKDLDLMKRIWSKGDRLEFMARYHATSLEAAAENFYRSVLANLRMVRPTSQTESRIEHLRPLHYAILAEIAKEKAAQEKDNSDISNVLVIPSAAGGLRQEQAVSL